MKKQLFVSIIVSLSLVSLRGQESGSEVNAEGKDNTLLKHAWTAQWITHPTASTLDYGVFHFRNAFELEIRPDSFIIHVSADNR